MDRRVEDQHAAGVVQQLAAPDLDHRQPVGVLAAADAPGRRLDGGPGELLRRRVREQRRAMPLPGCDPESVDTSGPGASAAVDATEPEPATIGVQGPGAILPPRGKGRLPNCGA